MEQVVEIKSAFAGASGTASGGLTVLGAFATLWPTENALGPLARIVDSFSPHLFAAGILFGLITLVLGGRLLGAVLIFIPTITGVVLFRSYLNLTVPVSENQPSNVRILFFNAESENRANSDLIVSRALEFDADILVFSEASAVHPSLDRLASKYKFLSPCLEAQCELLVASNLEVRRFWQLQLNAVWPNRYAVVEFETQEGYSAFLAANHLAKPWLTGISESEIAKVTAQYKWFAAPVVAVGDYNMSPWSLPMRELLDETGFRAVRGQAATWPSSAGIFGIPIDHILIHGGVRVTRVVPFGQELGSNHLGFVADISVPAARE